MRMSTTNPLFYVLACLVVVSALLSLGSLNSAVASTPPLGTEEPVQQDEFYLTAYHIVYNTQIEGYEEATYDLILGVNLTDERKSSKDVPVPQPLTLKASFLFGGKGASMQGTGRTGPGGLYIHYDGGGGKFIEGIYEGDKLKRVIQENYAPLVEEAYGSTQPEDFQRYFIGFGNWARPNPMEARFTLTDGVIGARSRWLTPWYSIAVHYKKQDRQIPFDTIGSLQFTSGETPYVDRTEGTNLDYMSFRVDDTGDFSPKNLGDPQAKNRIDVYVGEGEEALDKWNDTGDNRWATVYWSNDKNYQWRRSENYYGLYAGTTNPGKMHRYAQVANRFTALSPSGNLDWSVTSLTDYWTLLYAATITEPSAYASEGLVYRYDGRLPPATDTVSPPLEGNNWTFIGELDQQVCLLTTYKGGLYAGTALGSGRLYEYDADAISWGDPVINYASWDGLRSGYVMGDWLYLGDWYLDKFARWNGEDLQDLGYYGGSCIYSFEKYHDSLYAGAYMGSLYEINGEPPAVSVVWTAPDYRYLWALKEYQDRLYIGADWIGFGDQELQLWCYERNDDDSEPVKVWWQPVTDIHEGILSMALYKDLLYLGVGGQSVGYPSYMPAGGTGKLYRYDGTGEPIQIGADYDFGSGVECLYPVNPPR